MTHNRLLSKFHSIVKMAFFVIFFEKFFDYMYPYTLKIYPKNSSKISHFSSQSEFRRSNKKNLLQKFGFRKSSNLSHRLIKFKRRRPFLLLEVIIAMALIALCIIPLITPFYEISKSQNRLNTKMQIDHSVNQIYIHILEQLYDNKIPLKSLSEKEKISFSNDLLKNIENKENLKNGFTQFFIEKKTINKTSGWQKYLMRLEITIPQKNNSKSLKFHYLIPVFRKIAPEQAN